jgi:predicted LPLAT superfamily acyltransferase
MTRKRGNSLGFWIFRTALRLTGLRGAYGLLYFPSLHYLLFDPPARTAALAYLRRRFPGHGWLRLHLDAYRLFIEQGKNLLDRYYLLGGGTGIHFEIDGLEKLQELRRQNQGFILLTAHLGNWQAAMQPLHGLDTTVHLLMRAEENQAVLEALRLTCGGGRIQVLSSENFIEEVPKLVEVLGRGEIVSIMGDRSYGADTVPVQFLGEARFPYGAFGIAAAVGCPVVVLLAAKTDARSYRVTIADLFSPRYVRGIPKRDQLAAWAQRYAGVLEEFTRQHPFQCFLFHDVWAHAAGVSGNPGTNHTPAG